MRIYRAVHYEPNEILTVGGVLAIATARVFFVDAAMPLFVALILLAMTVHLIAFERGRDQAALDFCVTVAGIVYIGWLGSYLLDLRNHFENLGGWWLMIVLPIVWAGDTGAYSIGAVYGKHKMTPRLSPKKSWEGYFAGVFTSVIVGAFFSYAFSSLGPRPLNGLINPMQGAYAWPCSLARLPRWVIWVKACSNAKADSRIRAIFFPVMAVFWIASTRGFGARRSATL